ncbi:MAG: hypothetical protein DRP93_02800 [Candidatus Neomarinimicrobiota bacterium]|nr:MAG: hypothetical protein DRP93_02800 [Candidatus Neomarinimicrobiota bacterium]
MIGEWQIYSASSGLLETKVIASILLLNSNGIPIKDLPAGGHQLAGLKEPCKGSTTKIITPEGLNNSISDKFDVSFHF